MAKFSHSATAAVKSAVQTVAKTPDTVTAEGGAGFTRDAKSELYLLAITNLVSENTFYEKASDRDARFESLVKQVVAEDPAWIERFIPFLRGTMNMRSASIVMAAEYVHSGGPNGRRVIDSAIMRADEPAELLGYWLSHYGKKLPQPIKRGLADATRRIYNERSALKYDGDGSIRMADVIEFTHPTPVAPWQDALFGYLIATRHKRDNINTEPLLTIQAHQRIAAHCLRPR